MNYFLTNSRPSFMQGLFNNPAQGQQARARAQSGGLDIPAPTLPVTAQSSAAKNGSPYFKKLVLITNGIQLGKPYVKSELYSGKLGGKEIYTKEDAQKQLYNDEHRLVIDPADMEKILGCVPPPLSPVEQTENSAEAGLSNRADFLWAGTDLSSVSSDVDSLEQSMDYIASRFVAMRDRINSEFSGEQRETNLNKLAEMIDIHKTNLVKSFVDRLDETLDFSDSPEERERIYNSVLSEIDSKTAAYSDFAKSNRDYADINGPEEEFLRQDSAYMASELRRAMAGADTPKAQSAGGYTAEELGAIKAFADELASYSQQGSSNFIRPGNSSEESLGMKLAELRLKGQAFNKHSGVSDAMSDIVTKSIDKFITSAVEKEQAYMDKHIKWQTEALQSLYAKGDISKEYLESASAQARKNFSAIDKNAVYNVISKVQESYEHTGNAGKALMDGAVFAKNTYYKKTGSGQYDGVGRYEASGNYWHNFFVAGTKPQGETPYTKKATGQQDIINSWNSFMQNITTDSSAFIPKNMFSAVA